MNIGSFLLYSTEIKSRSQPIFDECTQPILNRITILQEINVELSQYVSTPFYGSMILSLLATS
ncbi:hypothetical protein QC457_006090 [Bacillus cereus]|nr:hypothetical protein [Bacillus cereus]